MTADAPTEEAPPAEESEPHSTAAPREEASGQDREADQPRLSAPGAQLLAWGALGIADAVLLGEAHLAAPPAVQALVHAYHFGHHLLAGLVAGAVAGGATALAIRSRWAARGMLAAGAVALCWLLLVPDLVGLVDRLPVPAWLAEAGLALAAGGAAMVAGAVAGRIRRRWLRGLLLTGAGGIVVLNHLVLVQDYPAVHLYLVAVAATVVGQLATGLPWPARASRRGARVAVWALAGVAALITVAVQPARTVWRRLFAGHGPTAAPFLAPLYPKRAPPAASVAASSPPAAQLDPAWMRSRRDAALVPPSGAVSLGPKPRVILLTVDALRADLVARDLHAKRLPTLHRMRREGVWFSRARSPAAATSASLQSLITGKYYSQVLRARRRDEKGKMRWKIVDEDKRFPDRLGEAGVRTMHFLADAHFDSPSLGTFDEYHYGKGKPKARGYARASQVVDLLLQRLREGSEGPTFMFGHLLDAHAPYNRGGRKGSPWTRYVAEVSVVDRQLERIVRYLDETEGWDRTLLIVSADHGEAFGEHGHRYHSVSLYEEVVRVPILALGAGLPAHEVATPVSVIDLGPTVLDLFDQPTPGYFMGQSLAPLLAGRPAELTRPLVLDTSRLIQAIVFPDGHKVIHDVHKGTWEFYDLARDPQEKHDLIDEVGAEPYVATLQRFFEVHTPPGYTPPRRRW